MPFSSCRTGLSCQPDHPCPVSPSSLRGCPRPPPRPPHRSSHCLRCGGGRKGVSPRLLPCRSAHRAGAALRLPMRLPAPLRAVGHAPCERLLRPDRERSEEHTSELQSLMRISYAVFCLKKHIIEQVVEYTYSRHKIAHINTE